MLQSSLSAVRSHEGSVINGSLSHQQSWHCYCVNGIHPGPGLASELRPSKEFRDNQNLGCNARRLAVRPPTECLGWRQVFQRIANKLATSRGLLSCWGEVCWCCPPLRNFFFFKSMSLLYLSPSHNEQDTRSLPITLGRKSLGTWWWMACPCLGATTRTPCGDCKRLGTHVGALSRSMFQVNTEGELSILNDNNNLVRVNGMMVLRGKVQLCDGDVLTIGRYSSSSWMTFHVKAKRVVTPETGRTRVLPVKKSIKRRRDSSQASERIIAEERSWLKTPARRRLLRGSEEGLAQESASPPTSQRSLFSSLDSDDLPKVTPQPRFLRKRKSLSKVLPDESMAYDQPPKRRIHGQYAPGMRSKPWVPENLTPMDDLSGAELPQRQTSSDESHDKKRLGTQSRSPSPCSVRESPSCSLRGDTVLSLPQCPSYDGGDSDSEEVRERFEDGQQTKKPQPAERMADELTTEQWKGVGGGRVRQALANLVVAQRSRRKDDEWLPNMLQDAMVEIEQL